MPGYAPTSAPPASLPNLQNLPQPRDVAVPDFTSNTYVPFYGAMTGDITAAANYLAVWTPKETRFVLRGGYVQVLCTANCAGTAAHAMLLFIDETSLAPVLPITFYHGTLTTAGYVAAVTPWHFDLGKGYKSTAKNNRLRIMGSQGIGGGSFICSGLLWGVQEL